VPHDSSSIQDNPGTDQLHDQIEAIFFFNLFFQDVGPEKKEKTIRRSFHLHPMKTNMTLENPSFSRKYIFIHGGFSIVMLVFGGLSLIPISMIL